MNEEHDFDPGFRPLALDVRHLRLIVAIVDDGSLTRAGERLNLTQSALSHQLKQIESSLGLPLFLRVKKRLIPTDAGEELVARARTIIADVGSLEEDLRRRAAGWRGTLRIATECYTWYEWLPPLLKRFGRRHRNVDVRIIAGATSDPVAALERGELDLAIVTSIPRSAKLTARPLFTDEMLLVVATDHHLAGKSFVRPADLASERLMLYVPAAESHFYQRFFVPAGKRPAEVVEVKLTEAMLAMVRGGLGVAVLARWGIASELSSGRLTGVRLGPSGFLRDWHAAMAAPRGRELPQHITDFADLIAESATPARFAVKAG
jgi:LysR family transcriptional regulator for metE and metH